VFCLVYQGKEKQKMLNEEIFWVILPLTKTQNRIKKRKSQSNSKQITLDSVKVVLFLVVFAPFSMKK
jgi:hypothetical protein